MKLWTYRVDTIDEDELRDSARDGGCPSYIHPHLYRTRNAAAKAMIADINSDIHEYNGDLEEDEEKRILINLKNIKKGEVIIGDFDRYALISFEVSDA